jgi:hypothetical protein
MLMLVVEIEKNTRVETCMTIVLHVVRRKMSCILGYDMSHPSAWKRKLFVRNGEALTKKWF